MSKPVFKPDPNQGAYKKYWAHYFDFKSTSSRGEFWWPVLWNALINFGLTISMGVVGVVLSLFSNKLGVAAIIPMFLVIAINFLFGIATLIPNISNMVRRYHDVGISGWWILLLGFSPVIISLNNDNFNNTPMTVLLAILILANIIILCLPSYKISDKYDQ